jgi:hypothetical protein
LTWLASGAASSIAGRAAATAACEHAGARGRAACWVELGRFGRNPEKNFVFFPFWVKIVLLWNFVENCLYLQKLWNFFQSVTYLGKILNANFEYFLLEQQLAQLNVKCNFQEF